MNKPVFPIITYKNYPWQVTLFCFWLALFNAMLAVNLINPYLPSYVSQLGIIGEDKIHLWSGIVQAAPFITAILAIPITTIISNKIGRKIVILTSIFFLIPISFSMSLAGNIYQLLLLRLLQGLFSGFMPAALSLITSSCPDNRRGYVIGFMQSAISLGLVFGPPIGGLLISQLGIRSVFTVISTLCSISFVCLLNIKDISHVTYKTPVRIHEIFLPIRISIICILLTQTANNLTLPTILKFVTSLISDGSNPFKITGLALGIAGVCSGIFAPFWGKYKDTAKINLTRHLMLFCAFFNALIPYSYTFIIFVALRACVGICTSGITPSMYTDITKRTREDDRTTAIAIGQTANLIGNILGPLLGGLTASLVGIEACFWVAAVLLLYAAILKSE